MTMSRRVPLVGDELIAYEEEQKRLKREEELKASLIKEEELKVSHGPDNNSSDPMVIDSGNTHSPLDGTLLQLMINHCCDFLQLYISCTTKSFDCTLQWLVHVGVDTGTS